MDVRPRINTIPPLEGVGFREFELRLTKGPIDIGEPGNGTYAELYSKDYLVFLDETGRLRVYVSTGTAWAPVPDELYPQPPHPGDQIRHIGACFDQAARLVLAYELNEQIYVYQWDPVTRQYITRGPFPGVDPVLIQDATIGFYPPDSDVLLLHLSTDRTQVIMRVQRELYGTPRVVATLPRPAILDQANAFPYYGQVVGSYVDSPTNTGFAIRTDVYPVYVDEVASRTEVEAPRDWALTRVVVVYNGGTEIASSLEIAPPIDWEYVPVVVLRDLGTEPAALFVLDPPNAWNYVPIVIVKEHPEEAGTIQMEPPTSWDYRLIIVVYDSEEIATSALLAPPTEWSYYV